MVWMAVPGTATAAEDDCDARLAKLPLIERPARSDSNATLVVLLTGDGGWVSSDQRVAEGLLSRGAAVIGLNMRAYLGTRRTPDAVAHDVACIAHRYLTTWKRDRLMLLGYSRGADAAPFVASRLPDDLRGKLNMVALVSLSSRANFQFHLIDLVRDVERPDDVLVAPELERLRGMNVICVYGTEEPNSACRDADSTIVTRYSRDGGHRITGGFEAMAGILEQGLRPAPKPPTPNAPPAPVHFPLSSRT
jgi:type IV secretory pathway VirJ component